MTVTNFHCVADNLRQSFRALAHGRPSGSVVRTPGRQHSVAGRHFSNVQCSLPERTHCNPGGTRRPVTRGQKSLRFPGASLGLLDLRRLDRSGDSPETLPYMRNLGVEIIVRHAWNGHRRHRASFPKAPRPHRTARALRSKLWMISAPSGPPASTCRSPGSPKFSIPASPLTTPSSAGWAITTGCR